MCRNAAKWLRARGVDFAEYPIRETPPVSQSCARYWPLMEGRCAGFLILRAWTTAPKAWRKSSPR
ncbi:hypothetical protein [Cephaloticoccus primus]|uniref:hypothetical protein n=1 Tax=Cephaloticoccus primus TaxID=1548207 RepID=UPI001E55604A|nr:hypothetical protein [Cephaloticoccus primus]